MCQHCYDRYYFSCSHCGRIIHEDDVYYKGDDDDSDPLCGACYSQRHSSGAIEDYYYTPAPVFRGDGPRFFGVELEIDEGGEMDSRADELLRIANHEGALIYCKHDGSLDDGFEIVTHPMSLACHPTEMPWGAEISNIIPRTLMWQEKWQQAISKGCRVKM